MANAIRRAAWRTGTANGWHEDLIWYAAAIHQMKAATPRLPDFQALLKVLLKTGQLSAQQQTDVRSIITSWSDPSSLGYQAQVHASFLPKPSWPSHGGTRVLWHECAHNHWFFLPWHRAYLLEFEAVARQHIRDLGGPADTWGLPYWNYSDHGQSSEALGLPRPLRGQQLVGGVTVPGLGGRDSPLFDPTREMTGDATDPSTAWADATDALLRPHFANQQDTGLVSFGGGVLNDSDEFNRANEPGLVDAQPHGSVHGQVGGSMGMFETAGLDPVFWMHHANVDRLWETYAHDLGHGYPFEPASGSTSDAKQLWETRPFKFLRPDGEVVTWTAPEVLHLPALGYAYDTTAPPQLPATPPPPPPGSDLEPFGLGEPIPEPVAAAHDVPLGRAVDTSLSSDSPGGGDFGFAPAMADGGRWVLRLDGIRAARPALTSYEVYLGLASGAPAHNSDATHYVGLLSLFGVYEATRDDGTSATSGRLRIFDVTDQVTNLGQGFDPLHPAIRFVPLNPDRDLESAQMSIERVTLDVA